jgi:hypothetical protein
MSRSLKTKAMSNFNINPFRKREDLASKSADQPVYLLGLKMKNPLTAVDIVITIFCDFRQFSAQKMAFFSKKQCYNQFFSKT